MSSWHKTRQHSILLEYFSFYYHPDINNQNNCHIWDANIFLPFGANICPELIWSRPRQYACYSLDVLWACFPRVCVLELGTDKKTRSQVFKHMRPFSRKSPHSTPWPLQAHGHIIIQKHLVQFQKSPQSFSLDFVLKPKVKPLLRLKEIYFLVFLFLFS